MDDAFHVVLLEGVYATQNNARVVVGDSSTTDVVEEFRRLTGREVKVLLQHVPPVVYSDRWGGGSCLWEGSGNCPAGHHLNPGFLLNVDLDGVLEEDEVSGTWSVRSATESHILPLSMLEGHHVRVVVVPLPDLEAMKASLEAGDPTKALELGAQIKRLSEVLSQLRNL